MEAKKGNKKACLIGCLLAGIVGAGGLGACVWTVFMLTAPVTEASDLFLAKLSQGKVAEAYKETASTLRARVTEEEFAASVRALGLEGYQSASWSSRSMENKEGSVQGTVKTKSGGEIPLAITLEQEDGVWRVASFTKAGSATPPPASRNQVPPQAELQRLVTASLLALTKALKANEFTEFHAGLATAFRGKHDVAAITKALSGLASQQELIASVGNSELVYDEPPSLDPTGDLKIDGSYVVESKRVRFNLWYSLEQGEWKLLSINVKVMASRTAEVPPPEELRRLVKVSLLAFNEAVKSGSFVSFHTEQGAAGFQTQFTPQQLADAFRPFIEQKIDISGMSEQEPVFQPAPAVNEDNLLLLEGRYPRNPKQVGFSLKYELDSGEWKLLGINVSFE